MNENQHPLTDEQYELLVNRHIDPRCLADEARSMGYEAGRTEKIMMSLPPQHLVFEKDNELIEKDIDYRDRLLALVEFVANWEPVAAPADPHHDPRPWQDCTRADIREGDLVDSPVRDIARVGVAHRQDEAGDWRTKDGTFLTNGDRWPLRRIPAHTTEKETPMPENTTPAEPLARTLLRVPEGHGAPHHDASRIKPGDYVMQLDMGGCVRAGIAYDQERVGDWRAEDYRAITWAATRADRPDALTVWPAPTPPAAEVELPGEPRRLTDVVLSGGETTAEATWTGAVLLYARHPLATSLVVAPADQIEQWTLDGTRAHRDGDRFVKVWEGEK